MASKSAQDSGSPATKRFEFFLSPYSVSAAFLFVQIGLVLLGLDGIFTPMGDIFYAYQPWAERMLQTGHLLGLQEPWVYPFPNLIFVLMPALAKGDYQAAWLVISGVFSAFAFGLLLTTRKISHRLRVKAAWAWIAVIALLGPVSVSRLDTPSIALAIIGVVFWIQLRVRMAAALISMAMWLKVWPVALLVAAATSIGRARAVLVAALTSATLVLAIGYLVGGRPANLLSFVTEQSSRGIQIESPWALFWLWAGLFNGGKSGSYFDGPLQTFQVFGPYTVLFANLLGPVMYLALGITAFLGYRASKAQSLFGGAHGVFAWTSLTAVLDLIVFNKVGSPQYYGWLMVPLIAGILGDVWKNRVIPIALFSLALLTGIIYPYIYDSILSSQPWALAVLSLRDVCAVALLIYCNKQLSALADTQALAV